MGALAAGIACGGDAGTSGLGLRFSSADVLAQTSSVAVSFYADEDSAEQCTRIRTARPRERAALGPFRQAFDDAARRDGTTLPLTIPAGQWAVLVDATASGGVLVGTGCAQDQAVLDGERTSVTVVVDAVF